MTTNPASGVAVVRDKPVTIDTAKYRHDFYGILNAQGAFWTPLVFESVAAAQTHIVRFWGCNKAKADLCLATFRIVPVRARLTDLTPARANLEPTK